MIDRESIEEKLEELRELLEQRIPAERAKIQRGGGGPLSTENGGNNDGGSRSKRQS